jgi:hypothetical protein
MIKRSVPLSLLVVLVIGLSQSTLHGASSSTDSASRPILSVASSARNVNVSILIQEAWDELPLGMNWADGSRHGQWRDRWNGQGKVGITLDGTPMLAEIPKASRYGWETHSALVTSLKTLGNTQASVQVRVIKQLRKPQPNPWEMGWIVWHYTDNLHFYYLMLKTNGWELGKEDPAYRGNMRTLVKRYSPTFRTWRWYTLQVLMVGRWITVWVDGRLLVKYRDWQRPYYSGRLGLYCEDSHVEFDNVLVTQA